MTVLQQDPKAGLEFYGPLFGWSFIGPGGPADRPYHVATLHGAEVAGIGSLPQDTEPAWITEVRVNSVEETSRHAVDAGGQLLAGPMDISPAGRLAVLADPSGAVLSAFEPTARQGAQRVNEPGAWAMSALQTPDPDRVRAFYGAVFGWQPEAFAPATLWRLPGYVGGEPQQPVPRDVVAAMLPAQAGTAPVWGVDFWVRDTSATAQAARDLGGRLLVDPHEPGNGFRTAIIIDPQGAAFSVSQLLVERRVR
ncbi:MAG: VOC family protein [Solirubrobacteraceae bacterium]